jgi:hypothetical protein
MQTYILSAKDSISVARPKVIIGAKFIWEKSGPYNLVPWTYPVCSGGLQMLKPFYANLLQIETGIYLNSKAISNELTTDRQYLILRHLSIPINCRLNTKYFFISGGPIADYLIKQNTDNWYDHKEMEINKVTFGINANAGLQKTFRQITLFVEGRYSHVLTSLSKNSFHYDPSFRNFGLGIGVNYSIGQNKKK